MNLDEELLKAAEKGDTKTVKLLLEKGANVNARNKDGRTVLMHAAWNAYIETVKLLIEKGADVNAKEGGGLTVLIHAFTIGYTEIAGLLIREGADVIYACLHDNVHIDKYNTKKVIINRIAEEKSELFTKEQKLMLEIYLHPEKIPQDKKKEVIEVLREFQKKGSITKEQSLELFSNLQEEWNRNTDIKSKEMRKPKGKPNGSTLKRIERRV